MCDPTAIAVGTLAIKAGAAGAEMLAQNKAAKAATHAALADERVQLNDLSARQHEEDRATSQQVEQIRREVAQRTGVGRASAAGAGVSGVSVDMLLNNIENSGSQAEQTLRDNHIVTLDQLQRMKAGVQAETQSRIAGVPKGSPLLAGLKIGSAGLDFATGMLGRNPAGA